MFIRLPILFVLAALPVSALASNYRCEDRGYLEGVLAELSSRCGGTTAFVCTALNYKGSSVESAVAECTKVYARSSCAQNVTCSDGAPICTALNYKGSTVTLAIKECAMTYARSSCAQNVTCQNAPVCQALNYKGSTVEAAIHECEQTYAHSSCAQNVTCN
jgi:hypothetical protein